MKPQSYWEKRSASVAKAQHLKADEYAKELYKEYSRAKRSIQRDIEAFYGRFATNNEIDLAEARKLLDGDELADFKMGLESFIEKAKDNADGQWTKQLDNAYYKTRVSRLQALQMQIDNEVRLLGTGENKGLSDVLTDTYTDTYYRTIFEVHKGSGIGVSFAKVDAKKVERIVKTPWLEENYSSRIWKDKAKLVRQLQTELTQAIIRGDSVDRTAQILAERMDVSYRSAIRLVQTEAAHLQAEATFDGYRASGVVKKFEFLAALDERTCKICGGLDGKIFTLAEKEAGVNIPPVHPRCRCTIVPYFEDEEDVGVRLAKQKDGKTYTVASDMTYEEWFEKYAKHDTTERKTAQPKEKSGSVDVNKRFVR